jgi:hypothetical protein
MDNEMKAASGQVNNECQTAIEEILCDMILTAILHLENTNGDRLDEQNQRIPLETEGMCLCASIFPCSNKFLLSIKLADSQSAAGLTPDTRHLKPES